MNMKALIEKTLDGTDFVEVAKRMGYSKPEKGAERIRRVISSPSLELDTGGYDLKYSSEEFLLSLCSALGLDEADCSKKIRALSDAIWKEKIRYRPKIFVDTNYQGGGSRFAHFILAHLHRWQLDDSIGTLPLDEMIEAVQTLIQQHYHENDGELELWGKIDRYILFYDEAESIAFRPDGTIIPEPVQQE